MKLRLRDHDSGSTVQHGVGAIPEAVETEAPSDFGKGLSQTGNPDA